MLGVAMTSQHVLCWQQGVEARVLMTSQAVASDQMPTRVRTTGERGPRLVGGRWRFLFCFLLPIRCDPLFDVACRVGDCPHFLRVFLFLLFCFADLCSKLIGPAAAATAATAAAAAATAAAAAVAAAVVEVRASAAAVLQAYRQRLSCDRLPDQSLHGGGGGHAGDCHQHGAFVRPEACVRSVGPGVSVRSPNTSR